MAQSIHPSKHPLITSLGAPTSLAPSSYQITPHKSHFTQERQESSFFPYNFHHQSSLSGRGVYWGFDEPTSTATNSYHETPIHNVGVNYCDYGATLHRPESSTVSPYCRAPFDESGLQYLSSESSSYFSSRQYYNNNPGE